MIRTNFEKFSPDFWRLMGEFSKSKVKEDKRFFIQEFNKIQAKMIPQTLVGDPENPIEHKVTSIKYIIPNGAGTQAPTKTAPSVSSP